MKLFFLDIKVIIAISREDEGLQQHEELKDRNKENAFCYYIYLITMVIKNRN